MPQKTEGTASIRKALSVMDCFTWDRRSLSLTEIAQKLDAPKPTALRILNALREEGYLERGSDRSYTLGWKCYRLGVLFETEEQLKTAAMPAMIRLRDQFNETVNLYIRKGIWRICYAQAASTYTLRRAAALGDRLPLWAGAAAKNFLAWMPSEEIDAVFNAAPEEHRAKKAYMLQQTAETRLRGYAISRAEREKEVYSAASAIFDCMGRPAACFSVSGPSFRFSDGLFLALARALLQETREMSRILGAPASQLSFPEPLRLDEELDTTQAWQFGQP